MVDYSNRPELGEWDLEVVDERTHKVLEYLAMLQRQGYKPTVADVEVYASRPSRKVDVRRPISESLASMIAEASLLSFSERAETYVEYLERLHWIRIARGVVVLTPLALALLRDLNSPQVDAESQSHLEVVVDPNDKMSYARLLHQFNKLGPGLLIDPYLRLEQFLEVADSTPATRILTSPRAFGDAPQRRVYQRAIEATGGEISVRYISTLHDRHYIPEEGEVWMLGISLNTVAKNVSVLTRLGEESSRVLRSTYEKFWSEATPLEPAAADPKEETDVVP